VATLKVPSSIVGQNVRAYVYYTSSLDAFNLESASCADLLGASSLVTDGGAATLDGGAQLLQTLDFDVSEMIPASALSATAPYLLLATGCPLASQPSLVTDSIYCGEPQDAGGSGVFLGDFHVFALRLDSTAPPSGKVHMQALNAAQVNNYWLGLTPYAYDFGVLYGDAAVPSGGQGNLVDPSGISFIVGPADGGPQDQAFPSSTVTNGPLPPPTAVPALTDASWFAAITSTWTPPGDKPFPSPGWEFAFQVGPVLQLSNLTEADLTAGTSFTLVLLGYIRLPTTTADGGPNPLSWNMRLIRNDQP
jgi:hypothetical protein